MVLAAILDWYGLRTAIHTYLFPYAFDMSHGDSSHLPVKLSPNDTTSSQPIVLEDGACGTPQHRDKKPTNSVINQLSMIPQSNFPKRQIKAKPYLHQTYSSPKSRKQISMESSRPGTTISSEDNEVSEIATGWFDIIRDDEDSESCCSSTGVGDSYGYPDEDQLPRPLELNSFAYDFFVKGVLGFLCEILEGGGRWGARGVRSTT